MLRQDPNLQSELATKRCVYYINANGGFTVAGSLTRGVANDSSNARDKIASENATAHLQYLMPSDLSILEKTEYENLKFRHTPEKAKDDSTANTDRSKRSTTTRHH